MVHDVERHDAGAMTFDVMSLQYLATWRRQITVKCRGGFESQELHVGGELVYFYCVLNAVRILLMAGVHCVCYDALNVLNVHYQSKV